MNATLAAIITFIWLVGTCLTMWATIEGTHRFAIGRVLKGIEGDRLVSVVYIVWLLVIAISGVVATGAFAKLATMAWAS